MAARRWTGWSLREAACGDMSRAPGPGAEPDEGPERAGEAAGTQTWHGHRVRSQPCEAATHRHQRRVPRSHVQVVPGTRGPAGPAAWEEGLRGEQGGLEEAGLRAAVTPLP